MDGSGCEHGHRQPRVGKAWHVLTVFRTVLSTIFLTYFLTYFLADFLVYFLARLFFR